MKLTAHSIIGFIATLMMTSQVFANASVASSTTVVQEPTFNPVLSGFVQAARSTSLYDFQDGTKKEGMDYIARFILKLNKNYSLMMQGAYSQDLHDSEASDFADTALLLVRTPVPLGKTFLLGWKTGYVAPTSKESYKLRNSNGAATAGLTGMINPDRLITGLAIVGGVSLSKNFHQYDTAMDGSVNTEYSSLQNISIAYDFAGGFTISGEFIHKNGLTYQNNIKEAFEHTEEFGYQFTKTLSAAIGHTNSGSALKANGVDNNIALMDENSSLVYISLTAAF